MLVLRTQRFCLVEEGLNTKLKFSCMKTASIEQAAEQTDATQACYLRGLMVGAQSVVTSNSKVRPNLTLAPMCSKRSQSCKLDRAFRVALGPKIDKISGLIRT